MNLKDIDISFDFQADCKKAQDPDCARKNAFIPTVAAEKVTHKALLCDGERCWI